MIIYDLACPHGHHFEGWFASGDDFVAQKARELVRCPICDDAAVAIVPSAKVATPRAGVGAGLSGGNAGRGRGASARVAHRARADSGHHGAYAGDSDASPAEHDAEANFASGLPAEMLSKLREIVRAAEDVGRRFPEEARRIHYQETPARAIRGKASREDAEALTDEGIEFASLPPILTRDQH